MGDQTLKPPARLPPPSAKAVRFLKTVALLILLAGLASAAVLWLAQERLDHQARAQPARRPASSNFIEPLAPDDSRRYAHEVERYYGQSGLLLDKATRGLEYLSHGKPLAWTVAVLSLLTAGGVFGFAAIARPRSRRDPGH